MMNETPDFNGGRVRIYPHYMHFSYMRYIENRIRESFELMGSPINLVLRKRK